MLLEISIAGAFACLSSFSNGVKGPTYECVPVLIGKESTPTPVGVFQPRLVKSGDINYGPDVLLFHESDTAYYLIHRPWKGSKVSKTYRKNLLKKDVEARKMSNGCVNIDEKFFDKWKSQITVVNIK